MSATFSGGSHGCTLEQELATNLEACGSFDFGLHSTEWNGDCNYEDDFCSQTENCQFSVPSLTPESFPSILTNVSNNTPSASYSLESTSGLFTPEPCNSSSFYELQLSLHESKENFDNAPSQYLSEQETALSPYGVSPLPHQMSSSWDFPPVLGDLAQNLFNDTPQHEFGHNDNEWENVGGTDILCKLVPECSKELLNYVRLPGQAKRRRYLTVRDMLNIKYKVTRVRSILSKNESGAVCDSPMDSLTVEPGLTTEEGLAIEDVETSASVLSPTDSAKLPEVFLESSVESYEQSQFRKRPHFKTSPQKLSLVSSTEVQDNGFDEDVLNQPSSYHSETMYKRPRHFDFGVLEIGKFQLRANLAHPNQLCRLKIIFSSLKFVYEYEIPPRVSATDEDGVVVTRVVSIEVPFSSVTALSYYENSLQLRVKARPLVFVGYRSSVPGQPKSCVYERNPDCDISSGELDRCSLHRIVFLTSEAINRVKFHLTSCHPPFDQYLQTSPDSSTSRWPEDETTALDPPNLTERMEDSDAFLAAMPSSVTPTARERVLSVSICSCKVSCRSRRCSCARQSKLCQNCRCVGCENPLNILQSCGIDVCWASLVPCLMNSIYLLHSRILLARLQQNLLCPSCGYPEKLLNLLQNAAAGCCPACSVPLGYSWCKDQFFVQNDEKYHHCETCQKCVDFASPGRYCPRCFVPF